jgi:small subunit ribosomal protein S4
MDSMARYLGPKVKLSRRVGVPIADIPKHTTKRQLTGNGMHGFRGRRPKDYGVRLIEKQKLRFHYHLLEKQFRRYVDKAGRQKGNTGQNLLQLLEARLDNIVRRSGFARTIWSARQVVTHGHVLVNGHKVDRPGYELKPGDIVSIREKSGKMVRDNMESLAGHIVPDWLAVNPKELSTVVQSTPIADQLPFDINTNLIVEFYR